VSKINFARSWDQYSTRTLSFNDSIGRYAVRGHSRDDPTPFIWKCQKSPRCVFNTRRLDMLKTHERYCSEAGVKKQNTERAFTCTQDTCKKSYKTLDGLHRHEREVHTFQHIPCLEGCNPDKLYKNAAALKDHNLRVHSGVWPTKCLVPSCECETEFKYARFYNIHLETVYGLSTKAQRTQHFPRNSRKRSREEPTEEDNEI